MLLRKKKGGQNLYSIDLLACESSPSAGDMLLTCSSSVLLEQSHAFSATYRAPRSSHVHFGAKIFLFGCHAIH